MISHPISQGIPGDMCRIQHVLVQPVQLSKLARNFQIVHTGHSLGVNTSEAGLSLLLLPDHVLYSEHRVLDPLQLRVSRRPVICHSLHKRSDPLGKASGYSLQLPEFSGRIYQVLSEYLAPERLPKLPVLSGRSQQVVGCVQCSHRAPPPVDYR